MIFVTVGSQMPFDRLIIAMDEWAEGSAIEIVAQIGNTDYVPKNIKEWFPVIDVTSFNHFMNNCELIIAHAGMGSIITSFKYQKPIIVMPRKGSLMETRNDHQIDTVMGLKGKINLAMDKTELFSLLDNREQLLTTYSCSDFAEDSLISALRDFIND